MKKISILLIVITLIISTGCSNKQVDKFNYDFKGENDSWTAEYKVVGTGTFTTNNDIIKFDSNLNKTLVVTYKKDISDLSTVKHIEISYGTTLLQGKPFIEDYNNGSHARKTYTIKSHTTGSSVETGGDIINVTINIDNKIQTIDLKNEN